MRLNQSRILREKTRKQIYYSSESQDAILWDIQSVSNTCRVKIQGSATLVTALFPENWKSTPSWLKPGNAVRVSHTGGNRGVIEVIGNGQYVPTAVSGAQSPTLDTVDDHIISGCTVEAYPTQIYQVATNPGSVLIAGNVIIVSAVALIMGDDSTEMGAMGTRLPMGSSYAGYIIPNAPHSTLFRYDAICVGDDGVVDYVVGTAATTPTMPATPADHLRIAYILIYPGMTVISPIDINRVYTESVPTYLNIVIADDSIGWAQEDTDITVRVYDQYNLDIGYGSNSWVMTMDLLRGDGTISVGGASSESSITGITDTGASYLVFNYARVYQSGGSPTLNVTLINYASGQLSETIMVTVEDEYGEPLYI